MTYEILLAGFGGQGILFAGKLLAYCALFEGKEISWLPSYGPEMRGGKCNCSVCISDEPIGSPQVLEPDLLVVLNGPSFDAFMGNVKPGGSVTVTAVLQPKTAGNKNVEWSLDVGEDIATIDAKGKVKISKDAASGTKITVTCKALGAPEPVTATTVIEIP